MIRMEKKNNDKKKSNKKRLLIAAVSLTVLLVMSIPVLAWFTNQRRLDTMAKIQSPTTLNIGAGNKEDSAYIDLGGIDVEGEETSKDFVFCVYSDTTKGNYKIQLAHTTNIAFTYKIYRASVFDENGGDVTGKITYVDTKNKTHYYTKGNIVDGSYLNQDNTTGIANKTKHTETYDSYGENYVQKNAEPLYWQNNTSITPSNTEATGFVDYYILEVSWEKDKVENNKETDMVYLTAGMV